MHIFYKGFLCLMVFASLCNCKINSNQPNQGQEIQPALPRIQKQIKADLKDLKLATNTFYSLVDAHKHQSYLSDDELKAYKDLRKAFKEIEFIIEYADKQFYDQKANGAPLPKLAPKDTDINIIEPKGLQVIDELMFGEINAETHAAIAHFAKEFERDLYDFEQTLASMVINQRQVFEALRYNIIRQATLSITGFDTPGSLLGLEDAIVQTKSNQKYLGYFKDELDAVNQKELHQISQKTLEQAQIFLRKNQDFETFDRLSYIQNFMNPLYEVVKEIHFALGYETWNETDKAFTQALNYNANNLFQQDFLDPFAFVSQKNDDLFNKKRALGKILFYDPLLSSNNEMACVSCHHPDKAFTDGLAKSISIDGDGTLTRNSMALPYSVYAKKMFWDVRVASLENQFEHVVTNEQEFHTSYNEIVNKLRKSPTYQKLFKEAFPKSYSNSLSINSIDYALSAYVMSLGKFNTKLDRFMRREGDLNASEKNGFNLFAGKAACATCHFIPTFSGLVPPFYNESESEVLGVTKTETEPWELDEDYGRFAGLIKESADFYKHSFKTVTVRNAEKTAPYMHNGAFTTLETLMDFYNDGGGAGRGLDVPHQTLSPEPLNLTDREMEDIILFMKTLTDLDVSEPVANKDLPRDFANQSWNNRNVPVLN
ncbi:MAG: cytochrome-c peroxidase [Weeksellaceae bacterium]